MSDPQVGAQIGAQGPQVSPQAGPQAGSEVDAQIGSQTGPQAGPQVSDPTRSLEPVQADRPDVNDGRWTARLVTFLRVMAVLSIMKGLYHWAVVCGIVGGESFETLPTPLQTATIFFAVIDLVAAVGLWLAAAWGAVVWLTASVSMAAVEVLFPQVYGGRMIVVVIECALLICYLFLAIQSAREHPQ